MMTAILPTSHCMHMHMCSTCKLLAHLIAGDPNSLLWRTAWAAVASNADEVTLKHPSPARMQCTFMRCQKCHGSFPVQMKGNRLRACVHVRVYGASLEDFGAPQSYKLRV